MIGSGERMPRDRVLRVLQAFAGILCIVAPTAGTLLLLGGVSELVNLVTGAATQSDGQALSASFAALLVVPPLAGTVVGLYLLLEQNPTRAGLLLSMLLLGAVLVVDASLLDPGSPIRIPSFVGHGALLALVGFLFGLRRRDWVTASATQRTLDE